MFEYNEEEASCLPKTMEEKTRGYRPGVIWPNSVLSERIAVYEVSVSSLLSVALPKYSHPFALASVFSWANAWESSPAAGRRSEGRMIRKIKKNVVWTFEEWMG